MSSGSYLKEAIRNVKKLMKDEKTDFKKKLSGINYSQKNPFYAVEYRPDLENSDEFIDDQVNFFQNLIGLLCWIIELGRIDIAFEVSSLSKFLSNPRTDHLTQALHVFKEL